MILVNSLIFIVIFLIVCNYFQLIHFLSLIYGPKYKTQTIEDKWINSVVKKKTGLSISNIIIIHDKKLYAMMAGLIFWPKMIISEGMYKEFSKDELEWVILHEAGHCVQWHTIQFFLLQVTCIIIGVVALNKLNLSIFIIPFFSLLLSFIYIQTIRWGIEYVADRYSIEKVDNPKAVISAQDKLRKGYGENSIFRFLVSWNIYPETRIKMAEKRIRELNTKTI